VGERKGWTFRGLNGGVHIGECAQVEKRRSATGGETGEEKIWEIKQENHGVKDTLMLQV